MKIYTKKGDQGQTSLFGGKPVSKDTLRIEAYGTVDELNCVVGWTLAEISDEELRATVQVIQKQLFVVGAELATVDPTETMTRGFIHEQHVKILENQIDDWERELKPLKKFILPGGSKGAAACHLARTVCRRAEREVVSLGKQETLRPELVKYLNRLSDWFFVLARYMNHRTKVEDILWEGILK